MVLKTKHICNFWMYAYVSKVLKKLSIQFKLFSLPSSNEHPVNTKYFHLIEFFNDRTCCIMTHMPQIRDQLIDKRHFHLIFAKSLQLSALVEASCCPPVMNMHINTHKRKQYVVRKIDSSTTC